jgi:hypothetical protein
MRIETVDGVIDGEAELSQRLDMLAGRVLSRRYLTDWDGISLLLEYLVPPTGSNDPFAAIYQSRVTTPAPSLPTLLQTVLGNDSKGKSGERTARVSPATALRAFLPGGPLSWRRGAGRPGAGTDDLMYLARRAGAPAGSFHGYPHAAAPALTRSSLLHGSFPDPPRLQTNGRPAAKFPWPSRLTLAGASRVLLRAFSPSTALIPRRPAGGGRGKQRGHGGQRATRCFLSASRPRGPCGRRRSGSGNPRSRAGPRRALSSTSSPRIPRFPHTTTRPASPSRGPGLPGTLDRTQ